MLHCQRTTCCYRHFLLTGLRSLIGGGPSSSPSQQQQQQLCFCSPITTPVRWLHPQREEQRLRYQLLHLQNLRRKAQSVRAERRRLDSFLRKESEEKKERGSSKRAHHQQQLEQLLPSNPSLESAAALTLLNHRDPRSELEFTRQLLHSVVFSLGSPVTPTWDPLDVKPQVFALDSWLGLPVFSSLHHLQLFCNRFSIPVRDPSGVVWATGRVEDEPSASTPSAAVAAPEGKQGIPASVAEVVPPVNHEGNRWRNEKPSEAREVSEKHDIASERDSSGGAEWLYDVMGGEVASSESYSAESMTTGDERLRRRRERKSKPRRRRRKDKQRAAAAAAAAGDEESSPPPPSYNAAQMRSIPHFNIKQARPLPTFGLPFKHPFCVGYFADFHTLLHNCSILPPSVDIILNPASPIEVVLAREHTDQFLHYRLVLREAFQRVERALQAEFGSFLSAHCPEVKAAYSACVPLPPDGSEQHSSRRRRSAVEEEEGSALPRTSLPASEPLIQNQIRQKAVERELQYSGGGQYELVILIDSDCETETFQRIQQAKRSGRLVGHYALDVIPYGMAAPHVRSVCTPFYDAEREERRSGGVDPSQGSLGRFVKIGSTATINPMQSPDSFFHDPSVVYSEPHALFSEYMKLKGDTHGW